MAKFKVHYRKLRGNTAGTAISWPVWVKRDIEVEAPHAVAAIFTAAAEIGHSALHTDTIEFDYTEEVIETKPADNPTT